MAYLPAKALITGFTFGSRAGVNPVEGGGEPVVRFPCHTLIAAESWAGLSDDISDPGGSVGSAFFWQEKIKMDMESNDRQDSQKGIFLISGGFGLRI